LADIFSDCQDKLQQDQYSFLTLLDHAIDFDDIIPPSFVSHFYAATGRPRVYHLQAMLKALLIQRIFSIPTDTLLILFLKYSRELRDFCGFETVPDSSRFTRFKQDFLPDLQATFDHLVDLTEPICQKLDAHLASMTIFDTSGIEAWVTENNPKYFNRILKYMKNLKKENKLEGANAYKVAYGSMPSHAASNPAIKNMYINGHFCYAYKFGMITNGLGIIRDIALLDKEYQEAHPDIKVGKKTSSPEEDKSLHDSKVLIPVLEDYFKKHPQITPKTFLGDAAFDTIQIYHDLFHKLHFEKAYIPLQNKLSVKGVDYPVNEEGIPCCPKKPDLVMKYEGKSSLRSGFPRMNFVCPKMVWKYSRETKRSHRRTLCEDPCTSSKCGRMIAVYPEQDLRAYPGTIRGTEDWKGTYKIRTSIEKTLNQLKGSLGVGERKTQNGKTLHADLLLGGITQLISVLVADSIHQHQYIKSLKPLIA